MAEMHQRRVIDLNPATVTDETLAALKDEVHEQTDESLGDIELVTSFVLDSTEDGGLDSHATVFTTTDD